MSALSPPRGVTPLPAIEPDGISTELILATPLPILQLIARLGPTVRALTTLAQLLTWSHPQAGSIASWFLVFGWLGACLFGEYIVHYGLNAIGLGALGLGWLIFRKARKAEDGGAAEAYRPARMDAKRVAASIEEARQLELAMLNLRTEWSPLIDTITWRNQEAALEATALLLTSYPIVLGATHFIPTNYIVAALGSLLLVWHSSWFRLVRRALGKSLLLRFFGRLSLVALGAGRGLGREANRGRSAVRLFTNKRGKMPADAIAKKAKSDNEGELVFVFTILEHQRWWIGLGFTPAMLPNERPSWSDVHLAPVSPPSSFHLPAPKSVLSPAPSSKDAKAQLKRTTEWKWLDNEWIVKTSSPAARAAAEAEKARRGSDAAASPRRGSTPASPNKSALKSLDTTVHATLPAEDDELGEWDVDEEGWQYSDNAWAKPSRTARMGRFTRRRAWQRRAVAYERTELVSASGAITEVASDSTLVNRKRAEPALDDLKVA